MTDRRLALGWSRQAACREEEPDTFFPVGEGKRSAAQIDHAKTFCRRCPVRQQCLVVALASGSHHGVWGGLSAAERAALLRCEEPGAVPSLVMSARARSCEQTLDM